jgi:hypothetical protein
LSFYCSERSATICVVLGPLPRSVKREACNEGQPRGCGRATDRTSEQLRQETVPALALGAPESNKKRTIQKIV